MENSNEMEIFKDIQGYPYYQISNKGRVWSKYSQKYMKLNKNNAGYYQLNMVAANGKKKKELVHRLVALAFIDNPDNLPQVDHINRNPEDNCADNLRWTSGKNNCRNTKINRIVRQYDKDGNFIAEYGSIAEAVEVTGFTRSGFDAYINRKSQYYKGFVWEFI